MSGGFRVEDVQDEMVDWVGTTERALDDMDLDLTATNIEHMTLLLFVMKLFDDRNAVHGDTWKQYGWRDSLMHMRSKLLRTENQWSNGSGEDLDDAFDLINYTLFFLRNVLDDNRNGTLYGPEGQDTAELITQIAMRKGDPIFVAAVQEALR